jgi:hypothetical protein
VNHEEHEEHQEGILKPKHGGARVVDMVIVLLGRQGAANRPTAIHHATV